MFLSNFSSGVFFSLVASSLLNLHLFNPKFYKSMMQTISSFKFYVHTLFFKLNYLEILLKLYFVNSFVLFVFPISHIFEQFLVVHIFSAITHPILDRLNLRLHKQIILYIFLSFGKYSIFILLLFYFLHHLLTI